MHRAKNENYKNIEENKNTINSNDDKDNNKNGSYLVTVNLVDKSDLLPRGEPETALEQSGDVGRHEAVLVQVLGVFLAVFRAALVVASELVVRHPAHPPPLFYQARHGGLLGKIEELPQFVVPDSVGGLGWVGVKSGLVWEGWGEGGEGGVIRETLGVGGMATACST